MLALVRSVKFALVTLADAIRPASWKPSNRILTVWNRILDADCGYQNEAF